MSRRVSSRTMATLLLAVAPAIESCHPGSRPVPPVTSLAKDVIQIEEPSCEGVAPEARSDAGCLCPWGSVCACHVRVTKTARGCFFEDWFMTDSAVLVSTQSGADGGVTRVIGIYEPCIDCWADAGAVGCGETAWVCGRERRCTR